MTQGKLIYKFSILSFISFAMIIFGARLDIINSLAISMPYWDDWGMGRFLEQSTIHGISFSDLYVPVNEHRSLFSRVLSLNIFRINNLQWDPVVAMVANSVIWTFCGLFLIRIANLTQQQLNQGIFITLILVLWVFPVSLTNTLWGVQSHNYFMILLALLSCWYIQYEALSIKWWIAVFCMFGVCLTLAGGSFVPISIAVVYLIQVFKRSNLPSDLKTVLAAVSASTFGLVLIFNQPHHRYTDEEFNLFVSLESFAKTMSWPLTSHAWPFILLVIPILFVLIRMLKQAATPSKISRFILSLYGFVVVTGIAIAIARAFEGHGPAPRYMEFISLAWISSTLAVLYLQNITPALTSWLRQSMILLWLAVLIIAIPWQINTLKSVLAERELYSDIQETNVRSYLNSGGDLTWLEEKPFLHIPYHEASGLVRALKDFKAADILPTHLQLPPQIRPDTQISSTIHAESPFIINGSVRPNALKSGESYKGEAMRGSFTPYLGGMAATGSFQSEPIEFRRPYAKIPVIGYLGYEGLTLKLVNTVTGRIVNVQPQDLNSKYAEVWREVSFEIAPGLYRLVAQDNSSSLWFGFAAPRSLGRLSFYTERWLENGRLVWQLGLLLLAFRQRKILLQFFSPSTRSISQP